MLLELLKTKFGYQSFKFGQEEIIQSILGDNDTLVVMPTGGGKSLCYQLPALIKSGTALVISPLIALMKDQVDALNKANIPSTFINSSLEYEELQNRIDLLLKGNYKLLYIAPERLESNRFLEILPQLNVSFLAVDEAHCISEWGHDFRPSYLAIIKTFEKIVRKPIIALTATASAEVQEDIIKALEMKSPKIFIRGFDRPNLNYYTIHSYNKVDKIIDILSKNKSGSTIIYCGTRKRVELFTKELNEKKINALPYHAGQHNDFRKYIQEKFINDETKIIIATNAFGMGIDKPDVRNVIHCDFTASIEAYYQEAGRAGRDGKPANCILLFNQDDKDLQEFFINSNYPPKEIIESVYNTLYDINNIGIGEVAKTPIFLDNASIANRAGFSLYSTESVINLLEKNNILKRTNPQGFASIKFTSSRDKILEYRNNAIGKRKEILEALLRHIGSSAIDNEVEFDLNRFLLKYRISEQEFMVAINAFELARLLLFRFPGTSNGIILNLERMPFSSLPIDWEAFYERKNRAFQKLDLVIEYANTIECKRNFILDYFHDNTYSGVCGKCSSCVPTTKGFEKYKEEEVSPLTKIVLKAVAELGENLSKKHVVSYLYGEETPKTKDLALENGKFFASAKKYTRSEIEQAIEDAIKHSLLIRNSVNSLIFLTLKGLQLIGKRPKQITKKNNNSIENDDQGDDNLKLFESLIFLRKDIATRENISESALISDISIKIIAKEKPRTFEELSKIEGISKGFIMRFGKYFIQKINDSIKSDELVSQTKLSSLQLEIIDLLNKNTSIPVIANKFVMSAGEIAREAELAIQSGAVINLDNFVSYNIYKKIKELVLNKPNITLKQIRSELKEDIDFALLRIIVASIKFQK